MLALYAVLVLALVAGDRRTDARALAGFVPDCVVLFGRLLKDSRVSRVRKLVIGGSALYLAMPFDLVPDFIPVAGQLDDVVVIAVVLRWALRGSGAQMIEEHWPGPDVSMRTVLRLAGVSASI